MPRVICDLITRPLTSIKEGEKMLNVDGECGDRKLLAALVGKCVVGGAD